jgi:hypothetical protein
MRQLCVAHLPDSAQGRVQLRSGPENTDLLPHQVLQFRLQADWRAFTLRPAVAYRACHVESWSGGTGVPAGVSPPRDVFSRGPTGALAEDERLRDGIARQSIGAMRSANRFSGGIQRVNTGLHPRVHANAAHVVVRDRTHLDRRAGEIDTVGGKSIDHRSERIPQLRFGEMPEVEIDAAVRRAATGLDFLDDGV